MTATTDISDAAAPGSRAGRRGRRGAVESSGSGYRIGWLAVVLAVVLGYLILVPALFMLLSSFKPGGIVNDPGLTFDNFIKVYTDPFIYKALLLTVAYAGVSSLIAVVCGAGLAWLVERTDIPGARIIRTAVLLGLAVPPFMLAISYLLMFSPQIGLVNQLLESVFGFKIDLYSLPGMMIVQGLGTVATVYLIVAPSFRRIDSTFEEAAAMSGVSPTRATFNIVLPLVKPALLSAGIVSLLIGFTSFDIPGVIGMRNNIYVFSTEMYRSINSTIGLPEYGTVSALGMFLLILLMVMARIYHKQTQQTRKFITITGKGRPVQKFRLGRAKVPFLILTWIFIAWYIVLPTIVLAWTSLLPYLSTSIGEMLPQLTLNNYSQLLSGPNATKALWNSALLTVITPTVVVVLAGLTSWVVIRSRVRWRRQLDNLAFLPFAMPDVIIGISILVTYLSLKFIPVYGTVWIILFALTTSYIAYGTRVASGGLMQIHPELEEAAQVSGASLFRTLRTVTMRLAQPALVAVWIWVATHALRALTAPLFLQSGRNPTVSTALWDYWALGKPTVNAAGGFLIIIILMLAVGIWQAVERRSERRAR